MIRIVKGDAPEVLSGRGVEEARALCDAYDADAPAYSDGSRKFAINSGVYGHQTVRDELDACQHGKCAFCEVLIPRPYADAHVEHWRPKGAVKQARGQEDEHPGYYWLAYDWDNLLLSCVFCNRGNKRTIFPIEDVTARARNHSQSTASERPLLLKPDDGSDPADDIEFIEELPRGTSTRGRRTIEVLGLDRLEHRQRDDLLVSLREAYEFVRRFNDDPHHAAQELVAQGRAMYARAPLPTSPFSAMAAAFIAANPLPEPIFG